MSKRGGGGSKATANAEEILHMIDPSPSAPSGLEYALGEDPQSSTSMSYTFLPTGEASSSSTSQPILTPTKRRSKLLGGKKSERTMSHGSAGGSRPDLSRPYVDAQGTMHDPEFRTFGVEMAPHVVAARLAQSQLLSQFPSSSSSFLAQTPFGQSSFAQRPGFLSADSVYSFGGAGGRAGARSSASSYHTAFRAPGGPEGGYSDDDSAEAEEEYARLEREAREEEEFELAQLRLQQRQQLAAERARRAGKRRSEASGSALVGEDEDAEEDGEWAQGVGEGGEEYDSDGDVTRLRTSSSPRGPSTIGYNLNTRRRYSRTTMTDSGYAGTISPSSPPEISTIPEQDSDDDLDLPAGGVGGGGGMGMGERGGRPMIGSVITPSPSTMPSGSMSTSTHAMRPSPSASRRSYTTPPVSAPHTSSGGAGTPTTTAGRYTQHQPMLRELSRSTLYPLPTAVNDAFHVQSGLGGGAGSKARLAMSPELESSSGESASSVDERKGRKRGGKAKGTKKSKTSSGSDGFMGRGGLMGLPDGMVLSDDEDNPFHPVVVEPLPADPLVPEDHHHSHHHGAHLGLRKGRKGKKDEDVTSSDPAPPPATTAPKKKKTKKSKPEPVPIPVSSSPLDEKFFASASHDERTSFLPTENARDSLEKFTNPHSRARSASPGPRQPFISIVSSSPPPPRKSSSTFEGLLGAGERERDGTGSVRVGSGSVHGVGVSYVPSQHGKMRSLRPGVGVIEEDYA